MAEALLTIENLTKSFGEKLLFEDISFGINAGQKSALIARNGAGKSTLLDIIMGRTLQDNGRITKREKLHIAYLPQDAVRNFDSTVRAYIYDLQRPEAEEPWVFEQRRDEVVSRMKVDTMLDRQMQTLSGGEQKKVALCRMLLDSCYDAGSADNLLILDEPTNHLDIDMIEWLEDYLARQRLAILMVTHDRYFLDHVCDNIYELSDTHLYHYRGGFEYYLEKKAEREANQRAEVEKARSLYRTELEWMRRMPQARGTKAQARIDAFYELEAKARTRFDEKRPQLTVKTERIGGKILELYNICYNGTSAANPLINDFSYVFKRGEKVGIVGPNGVGKSTLLNIITEQLRPSSGRVVVGQTIKFGFYTQSGMKAPGDHRVIDIVKDVAEQIELDDGRSLSAHQFLSYFGFDSTTQYNYFDNLSGGERRRLYLLLVLMANPNFLILDEPTNDLDIYTLQILEQFLQSYHGCLLVVSHDRSFLDHIVDHIFVFEGGGKIKDYHSSYTQYRLEKRRIESDERRAESGERKLEYTEKKAKQPDKRKATYKEKKEYESLEQEIAALGAERSKLETLLSSGTIADGDQLLAMSNRIGEIIALLDEKELRWLELDELV